MSDRRRCAAFFLPMSEQLAPYTVELLARRAGLTEIETKKWGLAGQPTVLGKWGPLDCEADLLTLVYFQALVLTFREDEFLALWEDSSRNHAEDRSLSIVQSFRNSCVTLDPVSAFVPAVTWPDPFWFVAQQEEPVLNGDVFAHLREKHVLLYLSPVDVADLGSTQLLADREVILLDGGLIVFRGKNRDQW